MRKPYKMKRTISVKQFIEEFGETFSEHVKKRLLDLDERTVLTRKDASNVLDIKHVEHTLYNSKEKDTLGAPNKEYVYGQFFVGEGGVLCFSNSCTESQSVMQSPVVENIYNNLSSDKISNELLNFPGKIIDDSNIDYIIDSILAACPPVSQAYLDIVKKMVALSEMR